MSPDLIHFVESPGFTKRIDKLASIDALFSLQSDLVRNPLLGDLMEGCGGARKGRVGDKSSSKGKHRDRGNYLPSAFFRKEREGESVKSRT